MGKPSDSELNFDHIEQGYETELIFDHAMLGAEDEDGGVISGLEIAENKHQREQGECLPEDLKAGDFTIFRTDPLSPPDDAEEEAWKAKHEAERERLIAQSTNGEHRNLLIRGHEMMRTCSGDDGNFTEPEPGPDFTTPKAAARAPIVVQTRRRNPAFMDKS